MRFFFYCLFLRWILFWLKPYFLSSGIQFFHIMISDGGIDLAFCLCYATKEVERFYKAYMKCEKDWKEVCAFFVFFFVVKLLFQTHTTIAHFRLCAS
ncbi:hypothetical protein Hanom_Chr12g01105311 [Helianthus anomalus]